MARRFPWALEILLAIGLMAAARPARAVVTAPLPLKAILADEKLIIFMARVETLDPDKPSLVLAAVEDLKNKAPFRKLPVNMGGDAEAKKDNQSGQLLKRLAPEMSVLVFASRDGKDYMAFVYSNGTWFQMLGHVGDDPDTVRWRLTHGEPYLRRTFKGTTEELRQIIIDGLANKKEPPPYNPKEEPGFGPEVEKKENRGSKRNEDGGSKMEDRGSKRNEDGGWRIEDGGSKIEVVAKNGNGPRSSILDPRSSILDPPFSILHPRTSNFELRTSNFHPPSSHCRPGFAVIPTVFVMGPMALLAALFPAVFGGLALFMRRWLALLSVAFTNSTLITLQLYFGGDARGAWWGNTTALWAAMTLVALAGVLWSSWRYRTVLHESQAEDSRPRRGERRVLALLSLTGLAVVAARGLSFDPLRWDGNHLLNTPWKELLVLWIGAWAGSLYILYLRWAPRKGSALPVELVVLWAIMFATANLGSREAFGTTQTSTASSAAHDVQLEKLWTFDPGNGNISSSPLVDGDRIYVGGVIGSALFSKGVVFCLDQETGREIWRFSPDQRLQPVFSSPCLADGRLYFGEGLHKDQVCRFFCLDASTGKELWHLQSQSHVESSPCVAGGKVFFGAGDDGIYAGDAKTGVKLWQFQEGLHVDASPCVEGQRLYAGSGVSKKHKQTEIFCLDTDTGRPLWRVPTELPVWGSPAFSEGRIYFGLGNGRFTESAEHPAGALLCVNAPDGQTVWQCPVKDAVLVRPAVDQHRVYFGSRDRHVYCVDRRQGRILWKQDMGSPVVASPRLVRCDWSGATRSVLAIASEGRVCCLDPGSGLPQWTFDVARDSGLKPQLFSSPAVQVRRDAAGERRRFIFGAGLANAAGVSAARVYCLADCLGATEE